MLVLKKHIKFYKRKNPQTTSFVCFYTPETLCCHSAAPHGVFYSPAFCKSCTMLFWFAVIKQRIMPKLFLRLSEVSQIKLTHLRHVDRSWSRNQIGTILLKYVHVCVHVGARCSVCVSVESVQSGWGRRSAQISSATWVGPLLWCVTVPGWTWRALSPSSSSWNTSLLYHKASCWERLAKKLLIMQLPLKQRGDGRRSCPSVFLLLSGCRFSAVIIEITDCFAELSDRGSTF